MYTVQKGSTNHSQAFLFARKHCLHVHNIKKYGIVHIQYCSCRDEVGSKWCPVHNESEHREVQRYFLSGDGAG